jgi:uncharacterized protein (TIGR02996 family)
MWKSKAMKPTQDAFFKLPVLSNDPGEIFSFKLRFVGMPITGRIHYDGPRKIICTRDSCSICEEYKQIWRQENPDPDRARQIKPIDRYYFNILTENPVCHTYADTIELRRKEDGEPFLDGFKTGYKAHYLGKGLYQRLVELVMEYKYPKEYMEWCLVPPDHNPQRLAFTKAIYTESDEDNYNKLVYADWLDDNGEGSRAEAIRLMCNIKAKKRLKKKDKTAAENRLVQIRSELKAVLLFCPWTGIDFIVNRFVRNEHHGIRYPDYTISMPPDAQPGMHKNVSHDDLIAWETFDLSDYKLPGLKTTGALK